jgi:hypothetical protein
MALFRCIVECQGIETEDDEFGFFATRTVRALSPAEAGRLAVARVERDWASDALNRRRGLPPRACQPVEVRRLALFARRRKAESGASFYTDDCEAQDAALRIAQAAAFPAG